MNKHAICILCNDVRRLQIVMANFPDNIDDIALFIVYDHRLGDKAQEFEKIAPTAKILSSEPMFKEIMQHPNILTYALSVKMIAPWYIYKQFEHIQKLLFLDDDVIITENVRKIFDRRIGNIKCGAVSVTLKRQWYERVVLACHCLGIEHKQYYHTQVGGTVLFDNTIIDMDDYLRSFEKYITHEKMSSTVSKPTVDFRKGHLDEMFYTALFDKYHDYFDSLRPCVFYVAEHKYLTAYDEVARKLQRKGLMHVMYTMNKMEFFENLIKQGVLKDYENQSNRFWL